MTPLTLSRRVLALTTVSIAALLLGAGSASAAIFHVNDLGDANDADAPATTNGTCDTVAGAPLTCTLRAALDETNPTGASDVIVIDVAGTIDLTNAAGLLAATDAEIDGNAAGTTVDAGGDSRVFNVSGSSVTLKGLTVRNGAASSDGAGIFSTAPLLTLDHVTVTGNTLTTGGGAAGAGIATVSSAALTLNDSTVSGNTVTGTGGFGGGIRATGALTLTRSTISGNSSTLDVGGRGGGIDMSSGSAAPLAITNSTISGNHSGGNSVGSGGGGGLFAGSSATPVTITGSTIAGNTTTGDGGGIRLNGSSNSSSNSIYFGNTGAITGTDNCSAAFTAFANNIDSGFGCGFGTLNGNQESVTSGQLVLGLLANNGGPTQTRALGLGSVAINTATDCASLTQDQRSFGRPAGAACDIGAFEYRDTDGDGVEEGLDACVTQVGPSSNGGCPLPVSNPPATSPSATATGPTGLRAAALKKCKKKHGAARTKCKKKANLLPI